MIFAPFLLMLQTSTADVDWESQVIYQIFPRSYRDSNGDRVGDLNGIKLGLPTIKKLGATAILLNPIAKSRMFHNYFPDNPMAVDPKYGTLADFQSLIKDAHQQGIKVLLDVECQYIADGHPWLAAALKSPNAPEMAMLDVNGFIRPQIQLPWYDKAKIRVSALNLKNPTVQSMITDEFRFWAKQGLDGFRIDHMMDDLDDARVQTNLIQDLWNPLITTIKKEFPSTYFIGEQAHQENQEETQAILTNTPTDATLGYSLRSALLELDKAKIEAALSTQFDQIPDHKGQITILENHDTDRFASTVSGTLRQNLVTALLFTLKGTPSISAGQELGMKGKKGNFGSDGNDIPSRLAYRWGKTLDFSGTATWYKGTGPWGNTDYSADNDKLSLADQDGVAGSTFEVTKEWIAFRKANPAFLHGQQTLFDIGSPDVLAFCRTDGPDKFWVLANLSGTLVTVDLPADAHLKLVKPAAGDGERKTASLPPYAIQVYKQS